MSPWRDRVRRGLGSCPGEKGALTLMADHGARPHRRATDVGRRAPRTLMAVGVTGVRALPATTRVGMSERPQSPAAAGPSASLRSRPAPVRFGHAVEQGQRSRTGPGASSCKTARWPAVISGIVRHHGARGLVHGGPARKSRAAAPPAQADGDRQWRSRRRTRRR